MDRGLWPYEKETFKRLSNKQQNHKRKRKKDESLPKSILSPNEDETLKRLNSKVQKNYREENARTIGAYVGRLKVPKPVPSNSRPSSSSSRPSSSGSRPNSLVTRGNFGDSGYHNSALDNYFTRRR